MECDRLYDGSGEMKYLQAICNGPDCHAGTHSPNDTFDDNSYFFCEWDDHFPELCGFMPSRTIPHMVNIACECHPASCIIV